MNKRPIEQVKKTKAARDRHTGNSPVVEDVDFPSRRDHSALVKFLLIRFQVEDETDWNTSNFRWKSLMKMICLILRKDFD